MKHLIVLCMALLPLLGNTQTVVNPDYEYRASSIFSIRSIERTKDCTRVNLRATFRPGWWFSFGKDDKITNADNPQQTFLPTGIEGLEFGLQRFMGQDGVHDFTVIYPPLPHDIRRIDLTGERRLMYKGVSLSETRHDPFTGQREAWMDAHPESPMNEMLRMGQPLTDKQFYRIGTATIRGQIGHYDSRLGLNCNIISGDPVFFTQDSKSSNATAIAPDGTFTATITLSGPTTVDVHFTNSFLSYYYLNPLYIEPGQTIDLFVDWEDDILAFDRSRGLLACPPMVLRGPLAEVNRQIREAPTLNDWQPRTDRDLKGNMESLMRHYNADMPAIRHYLKRSELLPKAKQYIESHTRMMLAAKKLYIPERLAEELTDADKQQFIAQMDASYYDFLREIDLNDITQFATAGGRYFLNEFASQYCLVSAKLLGGHATDGDEDLIAMRRRRAAALGYNSLPIGEQLFLMGELGKVWSRLHDVVNGLTDIDDISNGDLTGNEGNLTRTDVDQIITHPKLKAMGKRLAKECHKMRVKMRSMPSERRQWLDEHPVVKQSLIYEPYDPATFFRLDSVTIHGKIGRYDKSKPLVVCGLLSMCGGVDKTGDIAVADDGTFTIRAEVTHPGIVYVPIGKAGDRFYHLGCPTRLELYLEPGHSVSVYIDSKEIAKRESVTRGDLQMDYHIRGDLSMMSELLRHRPRFEMDWEDLELPISSKLKVKELRHPCRACNGQLAPDSVTHSLQVNIMPALQEQFYARWKEYEDKINAYYRHVDCARLQAFVKSEMAAAPAEWLCDVMLQRYALLHNEAGALEQARLVNGLLQMVDLDDFSFLHELPKDDFVMAGTPSGFGLMRMIVSGSWCGLVIDALATGKEELTDEEVYDSKNLESRMQQRLAFYGTHTLPLFEQAAFIWYVRSCMENLKGQEIPESSPWFESVRRAGYRYITHPGLRSLFTQALKRT